MGRLVSSPFKRLEQEDEENKEEPKKIFFLSCEGNSTEIDYFKWLNK